MFISIRSRRILPIYLNHRLKLTFVCSSTTRIQSAVTSNVIRFFFPWVACKTRTARNFNTMTGLLKIHTRPTTLSKYNTLLSLRQMKSYIAVLEWIHYDPVSAKHTSVLQTYYLLHSPKSLCTNLCSSRFGNFDCANILERTEQNGNPRLNLEHTVL